MKTRLFFVIAMLALPAFAQQEKDLFPYSVQVVDPKVTEDVHSKIVLDRTVGSIVRLKQIYSDPITRTNRWSDLGNFLVGLFFLLIYGVSVILTFAILAASALYAFRIVEKLYEETKYGG